MQNTIQRKSHASTTRAQHTNQSQSPEQANSNTSPEAPGDTYVASENGSSPQLYNPRMFQQRFGTGSSNGSSNTVTNQTGNSNSAQTDQTEGSYGSGRFDAANVREAHNVYRHQGNQELNLDNRTQVGQLISRSPQNDNLRSTNDDNNRCGGAAIMNAMLLDGDHQNNARAIRETMGDELTPQQQQSLDHMEAGRLTPNEAAQLQEAIYDHSNGLNHRDDEGLNRGDMRRTVAELRQHGAFQNTRELNFRRETVDSTSNSSHWTVSSRTTHGTHFADSNPNENGYATVTGGEQAAFAPWEGESRSMEDSVTLRNNANGQPVLDERFPGEHGEWQQRIYQLHSASGDTVQPPAYPLNLQ